MPWMDPWLGQLTPICSVVSHLNSKSLRIKVSAPNEQMYIFLVFSELYRLILHSVETVDGYTWCSSLSRVPCGNFLSNNSVWLAHGLSLCFSSGLSLRPGDERVSAVFVYRFLFCFPTSVGASVFRRGVMVWIILQAALTSNTASLKPQCHCRRLQLGSFWTEQRDRMLGHVFHRRCRRSISFGFSILCLKWLVRSNVFTPSPAICKCTIAF